jgi:multicomponent Na+:H+ antiporter subunit B
MAETKMIKRAIALVMLLALGMLFAGLLAVYTPDTELNQTARYYAERTAPDLGAANLVTAIIVTYRGLDTLGEVTVLFLASSLVGLMLAHSRRRSAHVPLPGGELLSTGTRLLTPLIMLLGVYVFVNGHLTPGGGFQGGAILASGALLMLLADPLKAFSHRLIGVIEALAGSLYVVIGLAGLVLAGGFLDNRLLPLGEFGELFSAGAIPVIYCLIGLKVGAEFASMLASLSETEAP